ncbi:MAG: cytochrome c3 family protein [Candidatus Zixiibacteriota bacterium]
MNRIIPPLTLIALAAVTASGVGRAADSTGLAVEMPHLDCATCHTCAAPTTADPCLQPCTRLMMSHASGAHGLAEASDSALLGQSADLYQPVHFNHKIHAGMAEMANDCATCHHFSPPGRIPPCRECHGGETNPNNLRQPGLKGAYHRQYLGCHREWSHDTGCVLCHLPQPGKPTEQMTLDSSDIMGIAHPTITEPEKKTYQTPYVAGPVVTFYHKENIDLFGLRCVDYHQQENCSRCHDLQKTPNLAKTQEVIHATCNNCHVKNRCAKCHARVSDPPSHMRRPAGNRATTTAGWSAVPVIPLGNALGASPWPVPPVTPAGIRRTSPML